MFIETVTHGAARVYERAAERGRMLTSGLVYRDSWIEEPALNRCFQLMEAADPELLDKCVAGW